MNNADLKKWNAGKVDFYDPILGPFHINSNLPVEWQTEVLEAYAECSICGLENDCRECEYFEYSLLYQLIEANPSLDPSAAKDE